VNIAGHTVHVHTVVQLAKRVFIQDDFRAGININQEVNSVHQKLLSFESTLATMPKEVAFKVE
jgi:hypothetical protein